MFLNIQFNVVWELWITTNVLRVDEVGVIKISFNAEWNMLQS